MTLPSSNADIVSGCPLSRRQELRKLNYIPYPANLNDSSRNTAGPDRRECGPRARAGARRLREHCRVGHRGLHAQADGAARGENWEDSETREFSVARDGFVLQLAPKYKGSRVLILGGGDGGLLKELLDHIASVER